MATVTFVDAGVLIAIARGTPDVAERALAVLDDPDRQFVSSAFVELEVVPKATYHGRADEAALYQAFFDSVARWADDLADVVARARTEARESGLSAMDALHVAAASILAADELVTIEKADKPIHRTKLVRVTTLR